MNKRQRKKESHKITHQQILRDIEYTKEIRDWEMSSLVNWKFDLNNMPKSLICIMGTNNKSIIKERLENE